MKTILLLIALTLTAVAQVGFNASLRTTAVSAELNHTHQATIGTRVIWRPGSALVMGGVVLSANTVGRYDGTSGSIGWFNTHFGLVAALQAGKYYYIGGFVRRVMNFASDLPLRTENAQLYPIVQGFKQTYPGRRFPYYNHLGLALVGQSHNAKMELFLHVPASFVPVLHTIPDNTLVGWLFIRAETFFGAGWSFLFEWELHSESPYSQFPNVENGTGGIELRKQVGQFELGAGVRKNLVLGLQTFRTGYLKLGVRK